uniref:Uncharacterized protein n=1 Tax=Branchiostoma floridae TaxID=7739 RepID=C4A059_BRAFL|eukprot:XP_002585816.1 hypothetical protein BRAFLDRAFT_111071 [Branchiostoma floridae]
MSMSEIPSGDAAGITGSFEESCRELAEVVCNPGEDVAKKTAEIGPSFKTTNPLFNQQLQDMVTVRTSDCTAKHCLCDIICRHLVEGAGKDTADENNEKEIKDAGKKNDGKDKNKSQRKPSTRKGRQPPTSDAAVTSYVMNGHDRHWTDTFSDSDHDEEVVVVPEIEPHKLHPKLAKLEPQTCQRYKSKEVAAMLATMDWSDVAITPEQKCDAFEVKISAKSFPSECKKGVTQAKKTRFAKSSATLRFVATMPDKVCSVKGASSHQQVRQCSHRGED